MSDSRRRECAYCPEPGADVCVRAVAAASGPDVHVYAHQTCAERRKVGWLYRLLAPVVR